MDFYICVSHNSDHAIICLITYNTMIGLLMTNNYNIENRKLYTYKFTKLLVVYNDNLFHI